MRFTFKVHEKLPWPVGHEKKATNVFWVDVVSCLSEKP